MDCAQVELTKNLVLSALGLAPNGGFNVVAVADSPRTDTAPDGSSAVLGCFVRRGGQSQQCELGPAHRSL